MYDHKVLPDMAGSRPDSTISLVRFDAVKEMDILRRVVLRDALVTLLADQRRKFMSGGELCVETVLRALLELREASLEVIDAITRWRLTLIKPEAFDVRGSNYVVAMTTDVGFLATGLSPLKELFGMEFGTGNPFALPCATCSNTSTAKKKSDGRHVEGRGKAATGQAPTGVRGLVESNGRTEKLPGQSPLEKKISCGGKKGSTKTTPDQTVQPTSKAVAPPAVSYEGDDHKHASSNISNSIIPNNENDNGSNDKNNDSNNKNHTPGNKGSVTKVPECDVQTPAMAAADDPRKGVGRCIEGPIRNEEDFRRKEADKEGVEGNRGRENRAERTSIREVLVMLGCVDDEQHARLRKAQCFLEEEVTRSSGKPRETLWWGFHRWTVRPWEPNAHAPPTSQRDLLGHEVQPDLTK